MLLGFKEQFVEPILDGSKNFTLRAHRKVQPKIGERLYMYTGLRTKQTFKISDKHILKAIQRVRILIKRISPNIYLTAIVVDGRPLNENEIKEFVMRDGFNSVSHFSEYWLSTKKKNKNRLAALLQQFHWTDKTF